MASSTYSEDRELRWLLHARERLPLLARRLSAGTTELTPEQCDALSDWSRSLSEDPAWAMLQDALGEAAAWPAVWERARQAGMSARTEHHNALFLSRQFARLLASADLELARWSFVQALSSWLAADAGEALEHYLCECAPEGPEELLEQTRRTALSPVLSPVLTQTLEALYLDEFHRAPERRPLRFGTELLTLAREQLETSQGALARGGHARLQQMHRTLEDRLIDAFQNAIESLDLTTLSMADALPLLASLEQRCRLLGFPHRCDEAALRVGLNMIWELRRLGRDDETEVVERLVPALRPLASRLEALPSEEHLELGGALADFYTFESEFAFSLNRREEHLRHALALCEGHRNASRLLSHLLMERANRDLLKIVATPEFGVALGPLRQRLSDALARVESYLDEAATLFPANERLQDYRHDLVTERERLGIPGDTP
ncbi:hypothetical protein [Lujinxingia litoralis]|nr:hypothetical protein [Lujinxingia litoralis]